MPRRVTKLASEVDDRIASLEASLRTAHEAVSLLVYAINELIDDNDLKVSAEADGAINRALGLAKTMGSR